MLPALRLLLLRGECFCANITESLVWEKDVSIYQSVNGCCQTGDPGPTNVSYQVRRIGWPSVFKVTFSRLSVRGGANNR